MIFGMLRLDLAAPDHTTLSRRGRHLDIALRGTSARGPIQLIVDSTGLSIVGAGRVGRGETRRARYTRLEEAPRGC